MKVKNLVMARAVSRSSAMQKAAKAKMEAERERERSGEHGTAVVDVVLAR